MVAPFDSLVPRGSGCAEFTLVNSGCGDWDKPSPSAFMKSRDRRVGLLTTSSKLWLRGPDLNRRPSGYEPDELPGCSTPRQNCTHYRESAPYGQGGLRVNRLKVHCVLNFKNGADGGT